MFQDKSEDLRAHSRIWSNRKYIGCWRFVTTNSYEDRPVTSHYHNTSVLSEKKSRVILIIRIADKIIWWNPRFLLEKIYCKHKHKFNITTKRFSPQSENSFLRTCLRKTLCLQLSNLVISESNFSSTNEILSSTVALI